jgi:hypothetical protein
MYKSLFLLLVILFPALLLSSCYTKKAAGTEESKMFKKDYTSTPILLNDFPWFDQKIFKTDDIAYAPGIKSVKLQQEEVEFSLPLLELGAAGKLHLSFDELDGRPENYHYTFIHCDAGWQPTDMLQFQYMDGFSDGRIEDVSFSRATRQAYVHYNLYFPDEQTKITKSGNYLLVVFNPDDHNKLILTKRFMVLERQVSISAVAKRSTVVEDANSRQEVDFEIIKGNWPVDNPYQDLIVVITQNNRRDNEVSDLKPTLVTGNRIIYNSQKTNAFDGTNEFRYFDIRTLSRITPRVAFIEQDSVAHHVYLKPDFKRGFQQYQSEKDLNGEYIIKNDDAISNSENEGDYAWVHFSFPFKTPFGQGDIYIIGALTNWQILPEAKLIYNADKQSFETSLFLKQGYYNYHYIMLDSTGTTGNTILTEGDHSETENFYTIFIYQRNPADLYDRLIGIERVISPQQR